MPKLFCTIAHHGFGHLAQTSAVLNLLAQQLPTLELTILSALDHSVLKRRLHVPFVHISQVSEPGMAMFNAVEVDTAASYRNYQKYHERWPETLHAATQLIKTCNTDLVLSNVSYLYLSAARQLNIPGIGLCSLNWYDIFHRYCSDMEHSATIEQQILTAYQDVSLFIQPTPSMPMETLPNLRSVGCIARTGRKQKQKILQSLGYTGEECIVLVALGGIPTQLDLGSWPGDNILYLVEPALAASHARAFNWEVLEMDFVDVLASADVLVTKPGYGSFTEAACNGIPIIYVGRDDWPESPYLEEWARQFIPSINVQNISQIGHELSSHLNELVLSRPLTPAVPQGTQQCVDILLSYLS